MTTVPIASTPTPASNPTDTLSSQAQISTVQAKVVPSRRKRKRGRSPVESLAGMLFGGLTVAAFLVLVLWDTNTLGRVPGGRTPLEIQLESSKQRIRSSRKRTGQKRNNQENALFMETIGLASRLHLQSQSENEDQTDSGIADEVEHASDFGGTVVLRTEMGEIRVELRPDLSVESCQYLHELVNSGLCEECRFYRADAPGILQGIAKNEAFASIPQKGRCPSGLDEQQQQQHDCPQTDPMCDCHGPIMTKGMVAWAGGGTGPDFFIDTYDQEGDAWGHSHTVFGIVNDEESFRVIEHIYHQPVSKNGFASFLQQPIVFEVDLEQS